ncbi:MAG: xanthine dehydrogenase family protein molybdopterin-binding subunit, partial [Thermodesulfobacteriota bacterium]|nr:xanthine dehydrogenase family protein molybdopterin-binding subunit [Thermodesulfobacteriota bacterium]
DSWVSKNIIRKEDSRLLRGRGQFVDDLKPFPNIHHAAILRSPHAHAHIKEINTEKALALPGVVSVLTGEDVLRMSKPFPVIGPRKMKYYSCAIDKVRFAGEPVAVVVAVDRYIAEDALELIEVEYDPLPVVVDPEEAMSPDAPVLHEEHGDNIAFHRVYTYGEVDRAFAQADVVAKERLVFPKYASYPNETYGMVISYDSDADMFTAWCNHHGPFSMHPVMATALKTPANKLRIIVPQDIGSSFGVKITIYPYVVLICLASKKAGVPVKWIEDRMESLTASSSAVDRVAYVSIAARKDGQFLGLDMRTIDNVGGYIRAPEPGCSLRYLGNLNGPYDIGAVRSDANIVVTNKSLTGPIRAYACGHLYFGIERVVERLAEKLDMDPVELRRRNLIKQEQLPYTTPSGGIYDAGDYPAVFEKLLATSNYEALCKKRDEARRKGKLLGIGLAVGIDPSASNMGYMQMANPETVLKRPMSGAAQATTIHMDHAGEVTVEMSTACHGQGHETVVSQIVADELGVSPHDISIVGGMDTNSRAWTISSGTYSSRFATVIAPSAALAARKLRDKMCDLAAHLMGGTREEVITEEKTFRLKGGDKKLSFRDLAAAAHWDTQALPEGMEPGLSVTYYFSASSARRGQGDRINSSAAYGFGADLAVVEVDPETFKVTPLDYYSIHDAGTILHPGIVAGQVKGSALHGMGAALYEELMYDENGQFLNSTYMDYICPGAGETPRMITGHIETPSPVNPLGSKGIGEASSQTAPVAFANAVENALEPLGIKIDRLPLTPHMLWHLGRSNG